MKNVRFDFWRVFWVVGAIYVALFLIGVVAMMVTPTSPTDMNLEKLLTWRHLRNNAFSFVFSVLFFYFMLNQYYRLISTRQKVITYVKPTLIAIVATALYNFITFYFLGSGKSENIRINNQPVQDATLPLMIFAYFFSLVLFIGISLLIAYLFYLRDEKKQRKILEEQKMQLEVEKSQANLNFLKAQINPHFLHNTLNFLYAKALPLSAELSEGILTLSDIMRYALSEGNAKNGKAPLKDEIEHVRNVIKIQQLRFENKLNVNFDVEGVVNGATIIPFVLITLVENAFKHGDMKNTQEPIVLKLKVENGTLYFYCRNRKKKGPKELSTGIGLENIKNRLDLTYGGHYSFRVSDENEFYTTELIIHQI